jgi:hypothetical protein
VLGYSYVFAYYMFSDMFAHMISRNQNKVNQNLFEDQQQQLESEVSCNCVLQDIFVNLSTAACNSCASVAYDRWSGCRGWCRI